MTNSFKRPDLSMVPDEDLIEELRKRKRLRKFGAARTLGDDLAADPKAVEFYSHDMARDIGYFLRGQGLLTEGSETTIYGGLRLWMEAEALLPEPVAEPQPSIA